jgi:hypothetical protein
MQAENRLSCASGADAALALVVKLRVWCIALTFSDNPRSSLSSRQRHYRHSNMDTMQFVIPSTSSRRTLNPRH